MNVGAVCNRVVICVNRDESARRAAELMRKYHIGALVVTDFGDERNAPVGIVTDRDIVVEVVARDIDVNELTVGDIMSEDPLIAEEGDSIAGTLDAMHHLGVRRVPVVDKARKLVGILALDDMLPLFASQIGDLAVIVGTQRRSEAKTRTYAGGV